LSEIPWGDCSQQFLFGDDTGSVELYLESKTRSPNDAIDDQDKEACAKCSVPSSEWKLVGEKTKDDGTTQ
jgi:hypothetical protein